MTPVACAITYRIHIFNFSVYKEGITNTIQ